MSEVLDPDALAELEREQAFLLGSLEDLDAELEAGDLSAEDHERLSDDYTRRLAEVARAVDERRVAFADVDNRLSGRQRWLTIVGIVVIAVLAGVLLARASGFRSPADSLSGDIRQSSVALLAEADTLTREGRWDEAIETYDQVLDISPANAEALTYRGWLRSRLGETGAALADLDEAVAIGPDFPDARVFRAILLDDAQRFDEAAAELATFDTLDAPQEMIDLVSGFGLRASIAGGELATRFGTRGEPVDLDQISSPIPDVVEAGVVLLDLDPELALRTFEAVIGVEPDNRIALIASATVLTHPDIVAESRASGETGLARLDRALELAPDDPQVRLARATARHTMGDVEGAASDLAQVEAALLPPELLPVFEELTTALS